MLYLYSLPPPPQFENVPFDQLSRFFPSLKINFGKIVDPLKN